MKYEQNEEKLDPIQDYKQSSLYYQFSRLQLEIKRLFLKLFEENIQETIQLQNQQKIVVSQNEVNEVNEVSQIEVSQTYTEYMNSQYQIYMQNLQQQNTKPHQYLIESSFTPNFDETDDVNDNEENNHKVYTISKKKVIKIINQGDLELYEQSNLFKKTIQTDTIKINDKVVMHLKLFKIITFEDEQEIVQERFSYYQKFKNENNNFKYNQNISDPEYQILSNPTRMLTSNIIDGYMNYLQIQDELNYFSLPPSRRKYYQRLFLFPSSLIANCTPKKFDQRDNEIIKKKFVCLFLEHIKQFSAIQYKFWLIYKKIGIVVNSSNFHWQFIEVKVDERILVLYDSLFTQLSYKVEFFFNTVFQILTNDENFSFKVENKYGFPKQNDGSSCGYYTCMAANYLSQFQQDYPSNYKHIVKMRQELLELFFPKNSIEKNVKNNQQSNYV